MEVGAMSTEYIPKSLALDIIARLCTDYAAAYAEISAVRGITIVKCRDCVYGDWDSKPDDAMVCTHNGLSGWYSGDDFCSSGKEKKCAKENNADN